MLSFYVKTITETRSKKRAIPPKLFVPPDNLIADAKPHQDISEAEGSKFTMRNLPRIILLIPSRFPNFTINLFLNASFYSLLDLLEIAPVAGLNFDLRRKLKHGQPLAHSFTVSLAWCTRQLTRQLHFTLLSPTLPNLPFAQDSKRRAFRKKIVIQNIMADPRSHPEQEDENDVSSLRPSHFSTTIPSSHLYFQILEN